MRTILQRRLRCKPSLLRLTVCACCLGIFVCSAHLASAQDLPAQASLGLPPDSSDSLMTISKRVDEVQLVFTVTDKKGRFVDELRMEDFRLLDNEAPPERVLNFQQRTDLPLQVVLLVDISSSVRARFKYEQKAATTFLKNVLRPGLDSASVISFGDHVKQVQPMTGNLQHLETAIRNLRADGDTALYDAILLGADNFQTNTVSDGTRKVMIILTDGADTASRISESEAIAVVRRSGAMVVVIDASSIPYVSTLGKEFLQQVTALSGGIILRATENSELKNALRNVEKGLRTQYSLSYKPAAFQTDGSYRSIHLHLAKPKWIAHCRAGYYASQR